MVGGSVACGGCEHGDLGHGGLSIISQCLGPGSQHPEHLGVSHVGLLGGGPCDLGQYHCCVDGHGGGGHTCVWGGEGPWQFKDGMLFPWA